MLVVATMLCAAGAPLAAEPTLVVADGEGHVWLLVESDPIGLVHIGVDRPVAEGAAARTRAQSRIATVIDRPLSRWPEAIAAAGGRLWILLGPDEAERRGLYCLDALFSPTFGRYVFRPAERLQILPPLDAPGHVAGLVGTARGPVALLVPPVGDAASPRLLRLDEGAWQALPAPEGLSDETTLRLVAPAGTGDDLMILGSRDRRDTHIHRRNADGSWNSREVAVDLRSVVTVLRVGGQVLIARRVATGEQRIACDLSYLVEDRLIPLAQLPVPPGPWAVSRLAGDLKLLSLSTDRAAGPITPEALIVRSIDPVNGALGPPEAMRGPPGTAGVVIHQSLLLALIITVTLLVLVARPGQRSQVRLPPDLVAMPLSARVAAISIDLGPGAIAALALLDAGPRDLLRMPLLASTFAETMPYYLMIGVTWLHSAVLEIFTGQTLGKRIAGGSVVASDGAAPQRRALVYRNLVKLGVLLIPPLVLLALLNPYLQGVHDFVSRTLVVVRAQPAPDADR